MYQVGVTGGIGSGKSLVCKVFSVLGVPVYRADEGARRIMEEEKAVVEKIRETFGAAAYTDGRLNRGWLADRVFGDPSQLEALNRIVHPAVREDYFRWVSKQTDCPYVIEEAAILFESGAHRFMDRVILVYAPEDLRIRRVQERDGVDEETVRMRMRNQMDEEEKRRRADLVITNDDRRMILPQILEIHHKITDRG